MSDTLRRLTPEEAAVELAKPKGPRLQDVGTLAKRMAGTVRAMDETNDSVAVYGSAGTLMPDEIRLVAHCLAEYLEYHGEDVVINDTPSLASRTPRAVRGPGMSDAELRTQ